MHGCKFNIQAHLCYLGINATGGPWNSSETQRAFIIATGTSTLCFVSKCPSRKGLSPLWIHRSSSFRATLLEVWDDTKMLESGYFSTSAVCLFLFYQPIILSVINFDVLKGLRWIDDSFCWKFDTMSKWHLICIIFPVFWTAHSLWSVFILIYIISKFSKGFEWPNCASCETYLNSLHKHL